MGELQNQQMLCFLVEKDICPQTLAKAVLTMMASPKPLKVWQCDFSKFSALEEKILIFVISPGKMLHNTLELTATIDFATRAATDVLRRKIMWIDYLRNLLRSQRDYLGHR